MTQPSSCKTSHTEKILQYVLFLNSKSQFMDRNYLLGFFLNTASALSTFLKMQEANLNMQNVILYFYATCQHVHVCRKGCPLGIGTGRMDSLLVLAHTS